MDDKYRILTFAACALLLLAAAVMTLLYLRFAPRPTNTTSTTTIMTANSISGNHVIVILLENQRKGDIIGNTDAPYINSVLMPNYSIAGKYYALAHPSLPNYIALTAGGSLGVKSDYYPVNSLSDTNLVDLLSKKGITWKAYMESMPDSRAPSCINGLSNAGGTYGYVSRHDPFVYYTDIVSNTIRCNNIVPLSRFYTDINNDQLPDFSFIAPNVLDDGHTSPPNIAVCPPSGTSLQCTDNWLRGFLSMVIKSAAPANMTIFVTWDESANSDTSGFNGSSGGNILLIAISPRSKTGFEDNATYYSQYSLLATIEGMYGLGSLGRNDSAANTLGNLFVGNVIP